MRLLLDEHISPEVAKALRRRGHDVIAVADREELRGRSDVSLLALARVEGRVVVTVDVHDFAMLGSRRLPDLRPHLGVVLVPRRLRPASRSGIGRLIRALSVLLDAKPADDAVAESVVWLRQASDDAG